MKAQWSAEDLLTLEQRLTPQGVQEAAHQVDHSPRETYVKALAMGYVPPNGLGPWPRRRAKSSWPAADEHILRQEFMGPPSVPYIAELLDRPEDEVKDMATALELVVQFSAPPQNPTRKRPQPPKLTLVPSTTGKAVSRVQNKAVPKPASGKTRASSHPELETLEPWVSPAQLRAIEFGQALDLFNKFVESLELPAIDELIEPLPEPTKWTPAKDRYLKAHYHQQSVEATANALGMTYYQTTARARRLEVSNSITSWSREETIFLLENIQTEPLRWVAEQLGRSIVAVNLRPKQLGIFPGWTSHDDQVLLKYFGKLTHADIGAKIGRPAYTIEKRERFLRDDDFEFSRAGLKRLFAAKGPEWVDGLIYLAVRPTQAKRHHWTQKEIDLITKNYPHKGSIWCAAQLGINADRVQSKAQALGIQSNKVSPPWTPEEDQWLLDNVHVLRREECAKHLKRTKSAVSVRASVLGAFKQN